MTDKQEEAACIVIVCMIGALVVYLVWACFP